MSENKTNKRQLILLGLIWLIACLPLFVPGIDDRDGQDLMYHLLRIEGIAEGLKAGEFPVRIQMDWMNGYGYPLSIYYGDLLLYLPAALRLIGLPLLLAYKVYAALIMAGTVALSYVSFRCIFAGKDTDRKTPAASSRYPVAILCTAAYTLACYHLVDVYVRQACGEYTAMMWLPLIAAAVHGLYTQDASDGNWKQYSGNACLLAIGMTGLIYTHILSTEMTVLVLVCVCIFFPKKTFRKNTLRAYGRAVWITVLASLAFLVPFLDYWLNVDVNVTADAGSIRTIQEDGVRLADYVASAVTLHPFGDTYTGAAANGSNLLALTPGLLLLAAAVMGTVLSARELIRKLGTKKSAAGEKADITQKGCSRGIIIYTVFSLVSLWVSSNLFPWNFIAYSVPGGSLLTQVQFPWRYLGVACLFLTLLLGSILVRYDRDEKPGRAVYLLALALGVFFFLTYLLGADLHNYRSLEDLDTTYIGRAEYLRVGTDPDAMTGEVTGSGYSVATILERSGSSMTVYVDAYDEELTGDSKSVVTTDVDPDAASSHAVEVIFPVLNYKGYRVYDDFGVIYEIHDGPNNEVAVTIPAGYRDRLYLTFLDPLPWTAAKWISFVTVLLFAIEMIKRRRQTKE